MSMRLSPRASSNRRRIKTTRWLPIRIRQDCLRANSKKRRIKTTRWNLGCSPGGGANSNRRRIKTRKKKLWVKCLCARESIPIEEGLRCFFSDPLQGFRICLRANSNRRRIKMPFRCGMGIVPQYSVWEIIPLKEGLRRVDLPKYSLTNSQGQFQ